MLDNEERVKSGDKRLGKYMIEASQYLCKERADNYAKVFNEQPSNKDVKLFKLFELGREVNTLKDHSVWGYVVKRKVLVNDKERFIDV